MLERFLQGQRPVVRHEDGKKQDTGSGQTGGGTGGLLGQYVRTFGNLKYLLVQICKGFCEAIYRDLVPHNLGTFLWILIRQRGIIY